MKIAFNPSTVAALTAPPNNKDITFDLRGRNIFARGVKFYGTDTNTWRDIKVNNVSIGSHTLDLRNGSNTTLTNTNGVVTINSTWRPVVDNLTSDSTTSSLSAKQGKVLKGLIDGKSNSGHTHDDRYLKLTGGTMTGTINRRSGGSTISGRDHAIIRQTYAPGGSSWNPIACVDTETGTWTLGHLSSGSSNTDFSFCFSTNADYNAGNNAGNYVTLRNRVGTIALTSEIPSKGSWNYDDRYYTKAESNAKYITDITTSVNKLTFTKNGSSIARTITVNNVQSLGKRSPLTERNAISGIYTYGTYSATDNLAPTNYFETLGFGEGVAGTIEIGGSWISGGKLYWRALRDYQENWFSWKTILDSSNYSSILDSRYYTESEVNSLLSKKLDRVNLSVGSWNPRGYHLAADYYYNGGDLSISENGGKMYVSIDGQFYQNEGQYRVLDTSDIGSIRGSLILSQYLSSTDSNWYPLVWGGSDHKNTNNSTGRLYKSYDKLSWQTSSQTLYATKLRTTNLDTQTAFFHPGNDSTLKIYSGKTQDGVSDGHIGLQTSIDNTDGQTHAYPTQYGSRCVLALQPRGGSVYIGNMPNGGNGRKLNVNGDIGLFNTGSIRDLAIGGGIYWNPCVESATDGSDAASITLVKSGVAGGTTLVLSQMNDANDTIQFKTSTAAKLYHNSYPILTTQNTSVNNRKGYIYGTEITQVNNSDTVDGYHADKYIMVPTTIDASALDASTYYPVTIWLPTKNTRIEVEVSLDSGTKPSWSTHNSGFTTRKVWESNGSGWGTTSIERNIFVSVYSFASEDPVRGIGQLTNSSIEYVYVRGGGKYFFKISVGGGKPTLQKAKYTTNNQSVAPTKTAPALITPCINTPHKNVTLWGQNFNGNNNVSGTLSGVAHIQFSANNTYDIGSNSNASRYIYTHWLGSKSGANLRLAANNSDNQIVLHTNGNVGIGTNSPSYKLQVNGDIHISHSANDNMSYNTSNPRIVFSENGTQAVGLVYTDWDKYRVSKGLKVMDVDNSDTSNVWLEVQGYNYSSGYVKNGSSNAYVLLGGGGHKAESSLNVANADTTDGVHINWSGTNDNPTYLASWDNNGKAIRAATRANITVGNSDKLDGYHENSFLRYRGATNKDQEATLWSQIGIKEYQKALPDSLTSVYNYGSVISLPGLYSRFEIYTSYQSSTGNGLYYRSGWVNDKQPWRKFIDSSNIGSQSVNYANSAGSASSADKTRALKYTGTGSSEITAHQTDASYMGRSGWASYIICNHGNGSTYYSQTIAMPFWGSPIYRRLEGGTDKGWKKFYTEEAPPSWNNITNKPSTFTPSSHTHTWISITDKIVSGNEFNTVNAGFNNQLWINYLPINDRSKTATIPNYHFGNGAKGYASIIASGFRKNGSNSSYVLLGDGGHKTISSLSVNYANSAGSATKASYVTLTYCRDDSSPSNKGLWNTIKNGTSSAQTNKVNFYTIYNSAGGPSGHGEMMEILSYNANYWQPQLWFGAGKTGGIYYRNKSYNDNTWGSWQTVAFTSQLKDPVNYYWANIKVSASSSTGTSPTFSTAYTSNWFRSSGSTGWYSQTYGGGIYMTDATWIRAYGNKGIVAKNFYASNWASAAYLLRSDGGAAAFNWSGQSGQPTWLWGGNSQHSYYVYNPSNFSVKYAASAGAVAWGNVTGRPSSLKNPYSLNVFGVEYDGSAAKTITTSTFISQVSEAHSTITDGTMLITSYASNSGFADTNAVNVPYKRKAVHLWDYIDGKVSTKYLPLAGGTMNANARISHGNGNLYIGRADNNGWVYTQDIASHAGTDKWSIRTSGAARFGSIYIASKTDTSFNSSVIECTSSMHLNHFSSQDVSLCNGGGKVGIGKSDPLYKLDVAGSGRFQDFVYCNAVYSNTLNHTSPTGYLIIGNKTKEISIRSSYLPDVPAVYLYQKFSTNVYYTANKGFGIRPYYLSSMDTRPTEKISGNTYSVVTVGDSVQTISCIIADKANIVPQIKGTLIRFLPGDDGQIVLLKDLNNYGSINGYFYVQPKGCNIIGSNNSNIHIADGNISDAYDDGKSRFFIYAKTHKVWIEFYCG